MTTDGTRAVVLADGVALLERSMSFTLGGLLLVTPDAMDRPTPCPSWDLRCLLLHLNESLRALHEAIAVGHLRLDPRRGPPPEQADLPDDCGDPRVDPVATLRRRAAGMVGAWVVPHRGGAVTIADRSLSRELLAAAGAVEVAVHGWDVTRACGVDRPLPPGLAEELLAVVDLLVDEADRPQRFGPAVAVGPSSPAGDRLLAFLGRRPH